MKNLNIKRTKFFVFIFIVALILSIVLSNGTMLISVNKQSDFLANVASLERLNSLSADEIAAYDVYDSRDYGLVTPVRDQGNTNLCWAYSSISASETSILKSEIDSSATKDNLSLSPKNLAYSRHFRGSDPLGNTLGEYTNEDWQNAAGNPSYCASLFAQWCGPTDKSISATDNQFEKGKYRLTNAVHISTDDIYQIKLAIAKYGAITFSYNNVRETEYYNPKLESSSGVAHAVTIIGWNDNIPANKFVPGAASQNGAWIVKNSYNSLPYFYLSYDNKSSAKYAFEFSLKEENEYNYFYDNRLTSALSSTINKGCSMFANVFEAKKGESNLSEYVNAVNIGITNKNVSLKVKIYTNLTDSDNPESGTLSGEGSSYFDFGGFRTVKLSKPVKIEKGSKFSVVVDVGSNVGKAEILFSALGGKSSMRFKDYWSSVNGTAAIKAITNTVQEDTPLQSIENSVIEIQNDEFVYNGFAITPSIVVKNNGVLLTNNNYAISYKNNINAGTALITIKGIGKYEGEKSVTFTIKKADKPNVLPQDIIKVKNEITSLSQIELPQGWSFKDSNTSLQVGDNFVIAEYFDKINYTNYSKTINVQREKLQEIPTEPPVEPEPPSPEESDKPTVPEPPTPEEPNLPEIEPPVETETPSEKPSVPPVTNNGADSYNPKLWWIMTIPVTFSIAGVILFILKRKKII